MVYKQYEVISANSIEALNRAVTNKMTVDSWVVSGSPIVILLEPANTANHTKAIFLYHQALVRG